MEEIQTRLQETSQNCLAAHAGWVGNKKNAASQETLQAAIHELRKVCSRLEIELAISERDQMTARPLPIPSHRAAKGKLQEGDNGDSEDNIGNGDEAARRRRPQQHHQQGQGHGQQQARRRPPAAAAAEDSSAQQPE